MPRHTLILGGARSGKSQFAETLALGLSDSPTYLATSRVWDDGHQSRISQHQARRDHRWTTIEEPVALVSTLQSLAPGQVVLVDCLTLWLTNLMFDDKDISAQAQALCHALPHLKCQCILVSNEVGMGVHPETELGNRFRDLAGLVNQQVAAVVDHVEFIIAGLPLTLKK